jgi:hypothetical protein
MFPLSWVLGTAGAVLIVIGAIGGGFSFSGSVIPRVGAAGRVASLALGTVLVFGGLMLDPALAPAPSPEPVPAPVSAPAAGPSIDQQVIDLLSGRPSFAGADGADLVAIAHAECDVLRNGGSVDDVLDVATSSGVSYSDAVYQLQVSVAAYCSDYSAEAGV